MVQRSSSMPVLGRRRPKLAPPCASHWDAMAANEQTARGDGAEDARPASLARRVPPQLLFALGAVSQYVGSAVAVLLFEVVPAAGVAWLRIAAAAGALAIWRKPWRNERWNRRRLALV